jgi:ribonuclease Z
MRPRFEARLVGGPFGDPGLFVDFRNARRALLFDLGDTAPLAPRQLLRLSHAFVSHTHVDHFIGFDRLLRIALRRRSGVQCFGPPGFVDQIQHKLSAYTWNLVSAYTPPFVVTATELDAAGVLRRARFSTENEFAREPLPDGRAVDGVLLEEPGLRVRCALLDHRTPSLAFALEEDSHVNVWRSRLTELGLRTGPWLADAKQAALEGASDDLVLEARWRERGVSFERRVRLGDLRGDALRCVPGAKIAYVTDVAYTAENVRRIVALAQGATQLFIEAVFLEADAEQAARKQHLTACQAGAIARASAAREVIPFHYSPRYVGRESEVADEVQAAFRGEARPAVPSAAP